MRKAVISGLATVLVVCCAAAVKAQDVSQADKDRALAYLESTKKGVVDATKGLSDAFFERLPGRQHVVGRLGARGQGADH